MMLRFSIIILTTLYSITSRSQSYTSYLNGNPLDITTTPTGGVCLMGGATEDDNAMKWFLEQADGGDVLILRTTGSDGYNDYFYTQLDVALNSVETIVCHGSDASEDPYVLDKIEKAEAIWFAGGDQWTYIDYWRNTEVTNKINAAIETKNIAIGGTSAGMAILSEFYFSAMNGTTTSETALSNPYNETITVDATPFIHNEYLNNTITDTHFDNPDRKGRLSTFLARVKNDYNIDALGIACDEYTAVCIDSTGLARVFGDYPNYEDNAYFVQVNCEIENNNPEQCEAGMPLIYYQGGKALKIYRIKGDTNGSGTFDLNNRSMVQGGEWLNWSIDEGVLIEENGSAPNCGFVTNADLEETRFKVFPNPVSQKIQIIGEMNFNLVTTANIIDVTGNMVFSRVMDEDNWKVGIDIESLPQGIYFLSLKTQTGTIVSKQKIVKL